MKFKGIIPEVKMSEGDKNIFHYLKKLKDYPIASINTSSLFEGELKYLRAARHMYPKKFLIRKDFIMIPKQIKESKEAGADAVLIIRDFLTSNQYDILIEACTLEKIVPITEIHNKTCEHAYHIREPVLVNSRNLNTGKFNRKQATELCKAFKEGERNVIYASGENSDRVIKKGIADAVLIGTAFMQGKLK